MKGERFRDQKTVDWIVNKIGKHGGHYGNLC
ncbi:Uncharacterised protein [uncultured archaeon]|nr:Uncharacterised protein [uncultured archaeon]